MKVCRCGCAPERKEVRKGVWVSFCASCRHRSEPAVSEKGSVIKWGRSLVDVVCLGCGNYPLLNCLSVDGYWLMRCRICIFKTSPCLSADGAIASWARFNRVGSSVSALGWQRKYEQIERGVNV